MAFYLFIFVWVSKLNDLITNICCNSETCLPTNKLLIKIYHVVIAKVFVGFTLLLLQKAKQGLPCKDSVV